MIIGLSFQTFTLIHVVITLIAIASGLVVVFGMIGSHRLPTLTALFWLTTVLTSVTGFMFFLSADQVKAITPAAATGIVATVVFLIALYALYVKDIAGPWRWVYALGAAISLYLNVFVLIVQVFNKITLINPAAPMLGPAAGPPFAPPTDFHFAVTQGVALVIFVMLGIVAAIKFRPARD
jgi:hypothetical protein